jgi:ubiquinone/menaquinone biosynthesis C-methylase UbiE
MIEYEIQPEHCIEVEGLSIPSFINKSDGANIDWKTIESFGEEWSKFNEFSPEEIRKIGNDYFDLIKNLDISNYQVLDVGCGSGRWSKYLAPRVKWIEAIDPSNAVLVASKLLGNETNVRVSQASVDQIPFRPGSFDLVISLGVLHHIPDTKTALKKCVGMVKPGGFCLFYLYYDLENRAFLFRLIFKVTNLMRKIISAMPGIMKRFLCDLIALLIYWPLSRVSNWFNSYPSIKKNIPLAYYSDKSLNILRNDALDRFGTPLEQRFSKDQIRQMMYEAGLAHIHFSENPPYWHVIGRKDG